MATLPRSHSRTRRVRALLQVLTALVAAVVLGGVVSPANAADGYRYWGYFHVQGQKFTFAQTGPAGFVPKDGTVEAYRFGTSTAKQGVQPRADLAKLDFATVCQDTKAATGKKRVAVLLDYGTAADAGGAKVPAARAACASVPTKANGQQVLAAVAQVRTSKGLICALDGYPATGCGDPVKNASVPTSEPTVGFALPASADAKPATTDSGSNTALLVGGGVLVVLLAAGGFALSRRTRAA
ncbi:MAG: SCO2322 family protein [Nocardioides sp.]